MYIIALFLEGSDGQKIAVVFSPDKFFCGIYFLLFSTECYTSSMVLVALYRMNSEHARPVYEFLEMLRRRYPGKPVVELDIDTREGAAEASLYDIVQYPALLVRSLDGHIQGLWEGEPLPLIDEVAGLLLEQQGPSV